MHSSTTWDSRPWRENGLFVPELFLDCPRIANIGPKLADTNNDWALKVNLGTSMTDITTLVSFVIVSLEVV